MVVADQPGLLNGPLALLLREPPDEGGAVPGARGKVGAVGVHLEGGDGLVVALEAGALDEVVRDALLGLLLDWGLWCGFCGGHQKKRLVLPNRRTLKRLWSDDVNGEAILTISSASLGQGHYKQAYRCHPSFFVI